MESKKRAMSSISSTSASPVSTHPLNERMDSSSISNSNRASPLPAKAKDSRFSSSPEHGYFTNIFPPDSIVMRKYSEHAGPNWTPNTAAANAVAVGMQEGNPRKDPSTQRNKDWTQANYYPDAAESPYFGSSVHYGGREFYTTSASNNTFENTTIEKSDDSEYATRGNWWKGSLYY